MPHPMQPLERDAGGTLRFKRNTIVRYLLDHGGIDLNALAALDFSQDDRQHFAQLIGYSLNGFSELPYVDNETFAVAEKLSITSKSEIETRNEYLRTQIDTLRKAFREPIAALYEIHPDNLGSRYADARRPGLETSYLLPVALWRSNLPHGMWLWTADMCSIPRLPSLVDCIKKQRNRSPAEPW